jgi:hypothetical protein
VVAVLAYFVALVVFRPVNADEIGMLKDFRKSKSGEGAVQ